MGHIAPDYADLIGCWADGAAGHQYTREACANTLEYFARENFSSRGQDVPGVHYGTVSVEQLCSDLRNEMSDDASEEDMATDWLCEHAPFDGAWWGWQDGDFGLWPEESEDQ